MEELIFFIIFIIFSALRSLVEGRQKTGQKPGSKPAGLPVPPVPRPPRSPLRVEKLPLEVPEVIFPTVEIKKAAAPKAEMPPVQATLPESAAKDGTVANQERLLRPQASTLLQGIVYAEVLGSPRAKRGWKSR